jgi:hypothetical protein
MVGPFRVPSRPVGQQPHDVGHANGQAQHPQHDPHGVLHRRALLCLPPPPWEGCHLTLPSCNRRHTNRSRP